MKPTAIDFLRCLRDTRVGLAQLHAGLATIDPENLADVTRLRTSLSECVDAAKSGVDAMDALIGLVLLAKSYPLPDTNGGPFGRFPGRQA